MSRILWRRSKPKSIGVIIVRSDRGKTGRTSCFVSCIAASIFGRTTANSAATASLAEDTKERKASRTPTFVRHFPASKIISRARKTTRVASGGNNLRIAFTAAPAAMRTTSPLSMYSSKMTGRDGNNSGAAGAPSTFARDWKAIAEDSRSNPDFLLVTKPWRILSMPWSLILKKSEKINNEV